jgi:hypothetical protein
LRLPRYRRLTACGVKPEVVEGPLYEYYWLYGAVEPRTGASFFLEMPWLNAECFSVYLRELGRAFGESLNVVVLDNAPAHVAKRVVVPANVVLVWQPPYSPELNPVERLWLDVKRSIDVRLAAVREDLTALREHVAEQVRTYTAAQLRSLTGYRYLLQAAHALE